MSCDTVFRLLGRAFLSLVARGTRPAGNTCFYVTKQVDQCVTGLTYRVGHLENNRSVCLSLVSDITVNVCARLYIPCISMVWAHMTHWPINRKCTNTLKCIVLRFTPLQKRKNCLTLSCLVRPDADVGDKISSRIAYCSSLFGNICNNVTVLISY